MKPSILYHGSPHADIKVLEPKQESPGHKLAGKYIFATQHKEIAAMFLAPAIAPMQMSKFNEHFTLVIQCSKQAYAKADTVGAIYELASTGFRQGDTDMPNVEWFTSTPVRPLRRNIYQSSLSAMQQHNVRVFFVDEPTYTAILHANDHGWQIMQTLTAYSSHS